MTYTEALEYIHSVCWQRSRPGLSRIEALMKKLGDPQKSLRFIHVAGTNGKGSVSAMTASVLSAAGYKVGLYTSPFIVRFNERMRIDGCDISDEELARVTEYVRPFADSMEDAPTEFELITAIAFVYFKEHGCDFVVLEAGMGGRLDSTNIIDAENAAVSVITGIAMDHTAFLGDTPEKIALQKESEEILKKLRGYVVVMAIEGEKINSEKLATLLTKVKDSVGEITFVVGSSCGISDEVKSKADRLISFSDMTFPHTLFRLMLCEQIYRGFMISGGGKYHK